MKSIAEKTKRDEHYNNIDEANKKRKTTSTTTAHEDDIVVDIGAHSGYFTKLCLDKVADKYIALNQKKIISKLF